MDPVAAFRCRLRELRDAAGYSRATLAARAGLSPGHLLRIEHGRREPTLSMIVHLARALKVDPGALFAKPTKPRKKTAKKSTPKR